MKKIVYVSDKEAQVTKAFAKNASVYGTEEFKLWREYKTIYSDAQMVVKTIRKNPNKKTRRNMTYANMEEFIKTLNNSEAFLAQFGLIRQRSQIQKSPYKYVTDWFRQQFPNYAQAVTDEQHTGTITLIPLPDVGTYKARA